MFAGQPRRYHGSRSCLLGLLKRGRYQPQSRCVFSFTLGYRFARTHMCTHKEALLNLQAPTPATPPPVRPSRRACLCQQMSGRRCVFLCLSLHSFHLLLQWLPICLWPRFISSHSSLSLPPPTNAPEDSSGSVVFQTLFIPQPPPIPRRQTGGRSS